ncbi:asparagine synthase (glutamine-hydrolyzing) [Bacteroidota bacterium]
MCGIAGIVEVSANEPQINESILKSMSDVIIHRGPDSEGQWISGDRRCGFAFRRLSIIDLSDAGNQPMSTSDGRFTIVFNGEIYNHKDIRKELEAKGYKYRSGTDTETILYGFKEWGKDIVRKMTGMWGISIWDDEKKELFCARDRIGIKPLYYTFQNGRFVFGSEIKSILQHPSISPELNFNELPNYLNFGMSGNRESLFKRIKKLTAGHSLTLKKDGTIEAERYWSSLKQNQDYTKLDEKDIQEEVLRILRQSIKDRMMSDVPFGVFLSGGIDSSLNVALMAELMDRPIDTYSVGFKELEKYNELDYARKIAKLYKTNHREILIDHNDAFPILEDLTWHEDEPNADPVCMPLYFLSKLTRDSGTTVIQVGEGSDEQFCGYTWMLRDYNFYNSYWKYYTSLPSFLRKGIYGVVKPALASKNQMLILEYLRRGTYNNQLYWSGVSMIPPIQQESLLNQNYSDLANIPEQYADMLHKEALALNNNADYLQRIAYVELQQRLAELLLMRVDKIGMAHSIEARVPFLDHRLVEFTMSLPPEIKVPDRKSTKIVLKKAVESILPHEIIYRKKQGFWAPVNEWLRNEWYDYAYSTVNESFFVKEKIFNKDYIDKVFKLHKSGKQNQGLQIFSLMTLSLWHKRFFE